jgi:hypothetical protein
MRYFWLSLLLILGANCATSAQENLVESAINLAKKETAIAKEQVQTYAKITDAAGAQAQQGKITGLFVRSWMVTTEKAAFLSNAGVEDVLRNAKDDRLDAAIDDLNKAKESLEKEVERLKETPGLFEVVTATEAQARAAAEGQVKINIETKTRY